MFNTMVYKKVALNLDIRSSLCEIKFNVIIDDHLISLRN